MINRTLILLVASVACGATVVPLGAQIFTVPGSADDNRPVSASFSVGFLDTQGRFDGQSGVYWNLRQAVTYRAALDVGIGSGALGVSASLASVPISRSGASVTGPSDGNIELRHYLATFRTSERRGFHQIVEVGMGLAQWASYSGSDVLTNEEAKARNSFALLVGYGIGFTLGNRAAVTIVQDLGTLVGSKEALPSGASRVVRQYTTRVGMRLRLAGDR